MSKEKLKLLKMVERGEISVDEALKQLEAQGPDKGDGMSELKGAVAEVLNEVGESLKEAGDAVNDVMNDVGRELRDNKEIRAAFSGLLEGLMSIGAGQSFEFNHSGQFATPHVRVDLRGTNGRLVVRRGTGEGFKLVCTVKVRANDQEGARARAGEAYSFQADHDSLLLEIKPGMRNVSVSAELTLPEGHSYDAFLHTSNGSISVARINGQRLMADTSNGSVELEGCCFVDAQVDTSNGSVSLNEICGNAVVHTSNGTIKVRSSSLATENSELQLATSNGSIVLWLADEGDVGYVIDTSTSNGRVKADLEGLNVKTMGRNQLRAESADLLQKERQMHISARTSNGTISIYKA